MLELLTRKQYAKVTVMLPVLFWVRLKRLYHLVSINYMSYNDLWKYLIGFSLDIVDILVFECGINRYFEVIKIVERVKLLLKNLIQCGIYGKPLVKLDDYFMIKFELEEKRKLSPDEIRNFFLWMEKYHYDLHKNELYVSPSKLDEYLKQYDRSVAQWKK